MNKLYSLVNNYHIYISVLTFTGVPTVAICTFTCTGGFIACPSIFTLQITDCNIRKNSSKAVGHNDQYYVLWKKQWYILMEWLCTMVLLTKHKANNYIGMA